MATATLVRPGRDASGDKLPIYPNPEPVVTLVETESPLTPYIAQARVATQSAFAGAGEYVEGGVSKWVGFERRVEREVQSVLPADESLNPGGIYVLISGLTGSVLTRTRSLPIRWLAPPLFALASAPYFLPKTSHNIRSYLSRVEDAHFPDVAREHDRLNAQVSDAWRSVRGQVGGAGDTAKGWGQRAVQGVEDATGLKVGNVRGEVARRVQEAKVKAQEIRQSDLPQGKLETVGYVVEQRPVAEIVAPVDPAATAAQPAPVDKAQPKTRLV